jgi:hypothetical protein
MRVERRDYLQVEKDAWAGRKRIGDIPVTIISTRRTHSCSARATSGGAEATAHLIPRNGDGDLSRDRQCFACGELEIARGAHGAARRSRRCRRTAERSADPVGVGLPSCHGQRLMGEPRPAPDPDAGRAGTVGVRLGRRRGLRWPSPDLGRVRAKSIAMQGIQRMRPARFELATSASAGQRSIP